MNKLKVYVTPYIIWMSILVLVPCLMMLFLSFNDLDINDLSGFRFSLKHITILTSSTILVPLWNSIKYATITTVICLLVGYPVAYFLASLKSEKKGLFTALLVLPLWTNQILRIKMWEFAFQEVSILNMFGISWDLLGTDIAMIIGMVSMYLPFMVFPIYSVLEKRDLKLIEAAKDLGANDVQTFIKVTLPLSLGGIVSGVIMTLLPAMTAFALPERLSNGKILLIGNVIEKYFMKENRFNDGSVLSLVLMVISIISFILVVRKDKEGETLI